MAEHPGKKEIIHKKRRVFARNLRQARTEAGLTQEDVVKLTGLTQSFLSRIETAKSNISLDNAIVLAEVVRQPLCKLLTPKE